MQVYVVDISYYHAADVETIEAIIPVTIAECRCETEQSHINNKLTYTVYPIVSQIVGSNYNIKDCTVEPRYTEVSGEASMIRYNEIFGIVRYLYITKLVLRSSNIRYNETYVNNIFTLIIL